MAYPFRPIWAVRPIAAHRRMDDHFRNVIDDRLHLIADCLSDDWIAGWAHEGVLEVEDYLGKHAAFESFLETDD